MAEQSIGFIGLGDMGFPMARRLLQHGFRVFSCAHRRREAIETLKTEGLIEKNSPQEVAERADILFTIVIDDQQTDAVLHGDSGALTGMKPGSVLVIMSTVSPVYCIKVAKEAAERGVAVLDCPVSGGNMGAEKGTLALIVGGEIDVVERCRAALETMGTIYHCGDVGMGQVAKLANNAIALTMAAVVGEACAMARSYDMDIEKLMEILSKSTGQSFVTDNWGYVTSQWHHLYDMAHKDVRLCVEAGKANNIELPLIQMRLSQDWTVNPGKI